MKRVFKLIMLAILGLTLSLSCAREEIGGPEREDGQMELTVTGVLGEYEAAEGTKASLVNNLRVQWTNGASIYVFQQSDGKYLGSLTAIAEIEGKVATLSGNILPGSGTLVFVYSTTAPSSSLNSGSTYTRLDISLASQGADTPFVVYGTANFPDTIEALNGLVVNFRFATSVVSAYASGLPATTAITEASLKGAGVNTVCSLSITGGGTPTGKDVGTIEKTGLGMSNSAGHAMVQFAVPVCPSGERVCYLTAGKKYGTTLVDSDPLLIARAYSAITPMENDLSSEKTANCYIVSASGRYRFNASVKGNSTESVGTPNRVEVLWESFGNNIIPSVGDLIKPESVTLSDGYVTFEATDKKGNAVIAVKDGSTILWSWHIWLTDEPADQVYANNAGTMMDRNLGATAADGTTDANKLASYGLLYQWGRKDPFLGENGINSNTQAASTLSWPAAEYASTHLSSNNNTLDYSIQNPTKFLRVTQSPFDWYCTDSHYQNNNLWKSSAVTGSPKTMYDPCPPGYRVPDGGGDGVWSKSDFSNSTMGAFGNGYNFSTLSSGTTWYPATGHLSYSGVNFDAGSIGYYWSCTPEGTSAYGLYFDGSSVIPAGSNARTFGRSVRCLIDRSEGINGYEYVEIGGLYWAKTNIGAATVNDYGDLYAWGETETKSDYFSSSYTAGSISTNLSGDNDVAHVKWGSSWRMPSKDDFIELDKACGGSGTNNYQPMTAIASSHIEGDKVKKGRYWLEANQTILSSIDELMDITAAGMLYSDGENYLFFPAAGYHGDFRLEIGTSGRYWSSTWYNSNVAYYLCFNLNNGIELESTNTRSTGRTVRPVSDK